MKTKMAMMLMATTCFGALAGAAHAQSGESTLGGSINTSAVDLFARDKNVSVRQRPHPEYEANGLRTGSFLVFPRLETSVETNDNIYATQTNEQSDTVARFAPSISLVSNWNRHYLQAYARGVITRYSDFDLENTEDSEFGVNGRLDVQRNASIDGAASFAKLSEPRAAQNTPNASAEPIEYTLGRMNLAGQHTFNRVKLGVTGDWSRYDYDDGRTFATATVPSVVIDQDVRDRDVVSVGARADYAVSPDTALFLQVTGNKRSYDIASTPLTAARDSKGYEVLAGADFELSNLIRGDAAVGFVSQNFKDSRFDDIDGFGARVNLEWFPTELTTLSGSLSRVVEDSVVVGAGGFLSTTASAQVDHELLRNIILTGQVAYAEDDFKGVDRTDSRWLGALTGTYLLNRYVGIGLTYSRLDQTSEGLNRGREFIVQKAALSLILQR